MAEEIRADRKRAEYFLLNYVQELALYHTRREEYVRGERQGSGGNLPGHPTEAEAIRGLRFDETYAAYNGLWSLSSAGLPSASACLSQHVARHRSASPGEGVEHGSS